MTDNERARAYLAKLPPAIAGQGGHAATFGAAYRLVEFGLDEADAWLALRDWNDSNCQPRWAEPELRHKLADAYRNASPHRRFTAPRSDKAAWRSPLAASPLARRPALPPLRTGTSTELASLATLRGLSIDGVKLTAERGFLRFGEFRRHPAWFIADASGRVVQAREVPSILRSGLPGGRK